MPHDLACGLNPLGVHLRVALHHILDLIFPSRRRDRVILDRERARDVHHERHCHRVDGPERASAVAERTLLPVDSQPAETAPASWELAPELQSSRGPEVQSSRAPEVQRSRGPE
eukprot:2580022-Prymnesium_polylepis.1